MSCLVYQEKDLCIVKSKISKVRYASYSESFFSKHQTPNPINLIFQKVQELLEVPPIH